MDTNYRIDYDQIKQQYAGTLTLEGKKMANQLLEIEINTKENNITAYDKDASNKETAIVFTTITVFMAIIGATKNMFPNEVNLYAFLVVISFIIILAFLSY